MKNKQNLFASIVASIGVVFGDIGTSPLYAFKSCFHIGNFSLTAANIIGLNSLLIWVIILMVGIKYVYFVMRFDHQGDGGILVLSNLCKQLSFRKSPIPSITLGVVGASLFMSDGVITPAISVLSALEGLHLISPQLSEYVLPLSVIVLLILFALQHYGSEKVGRYFGPIMIIWFTVIALLGATSVWQAPQILAAINPYYAIKLFTNNGWPAIFVLGGTILVITGAEALYADIGHFGKKPVRLSWTFFVCPALLVNYLGQGALLLRTPNALENPFFYLVPPILLYPMVILATVATVIASQSIIAGVFSITWQAIMLNYLPRMRVEHTSHHQIGQVYAPTANKLLCCMTIIAVLGFQKSDNLAVAYGLSTAGVMLLTSIMTFTLAYHLAKQPPQQDGSWRWQPWQLIIIFTPIFLLDSTFFIANFVKLFEGAWYTIGISYIIYIVITTWQKGNNIIQHNKQAIHKNLSNFINAHIERYPQRLPGTSIFMSRYHLQVPQSLLAHLHHNKLLHEKMICISIITEDVPRLHGSHRFEHKVIGHNVFFIAARYGFKEIPDLNRVMAWAQEIGIIDKTEEILFYVGKSVPVASKSTSLSGATEALYIWLSKNACSAYEFYKIPRHKVLELGIWYLV